jgi:ribosomal protein L2
MAVVKTKPTSPGRRFVVKVVDSELHKGAPHKALLTPQKKSGGRNNAGALRHVTVVAAISSTIELSIGSATRTGFQPL